MPPKSNETSALDNCRLCQQIPGCVQIIDDNKFIEQVFECTKIKINNNQMHMLPKKVCRFCKVRIERFFTFVQEIRLVDQNLHEQFAKSMETKQDILPLPNIKLCKEDLDIKISDDICFKCPACLKIFAQFQHLQLHMQSHAELHCATCSETFNDVLLRERHTCNNVKEENISEIECDDNSLQTITYLDDTEQANAEPKLCDIFESPGLEKECLEVEFAADSDNEESYGEVKIDVSNIREENVSKTDEDVRSLEANTEDDSTGYYSCNLCDKKYLCYSHLRAHQKIHGNFFPCTFKNCRKVCTSAYSLETHTLKHKGKLPFLCSTCGKGLTTKSSLKCHEKIHAKVKEYVCKECNLSFSIRNTLRAHQKKEHEGIRFYCSQCPQIFTSRGPLERHELVHKGVKSFECETCDAKFYTNKELLNHQRYHKGLRQYKCDICYKTFFEKHHLTVHTRLHTGERPYVCKMPGCGRCFVDSQSLSLHKKSKHA